MLQPLSLSLSLFSFPMFLFLLSWFLVSLFWLFWRTLSFTVCKVYHYWHPALLRRSLKERKELILDLWSPWYALQLTGVSLLCSECFCLVKVVPILVYCCYTDRVCSLRFSSLLVWPSRAFFAFSALCFDRVSQCWLTYATHLRRAVRSIEYHIYIKLSRVDPSISRASISEGCQLWYQLLPLRK